MTNIIMNPSTSMQLHRTFICTYMHFRCLLSWMTNRSSKSSSHLLLFTYDVITRLTIHAYIIATTVKLRRIVGIAWITIIAETRFKARSVSLWWRIASKNRKLPERSERLVRKDWGGFARLKHRVRRVWLFFRPPSLTVFHLEPLSFPSDQILPLASLFDAGRGRRDVRLDSANLRETSMPELVHGTEPSGRWGFIVFAE